MYDYVVVGAGIVGLSVAMQLSEAHPAAKVLVVEKESEISQHQTGRNSGVIHSGIYYKPGNMKARFAKKGNRHLMEFCQKEGVPYEQCGKLIVAVNEGELPQLEALYQRGLQNGLSVRKVSKQEIREREPYLTALAGIFVPSTGIVDFKQIAAAYAHKLKGNGGELMLETKVLDIDTRIDHLVIKTSRGSFKAKMLVNCAGLYSDKIAEAAGIKLDMRIVPFRGEYFRLKEDKADLVKHLVYPVPHADFPFLGVHFTRMLDGSVHIGPNAVPSLKREGYSKTAINLKELYETVSYKPFWRIAFGNMGEGLKEMGKSFSKSLFIKGVHAYFPQLNEEDIVPAEAGVRAQALDADGNLLEDFFIVKTERMIHVCNSPSPAATASLEIGAYIVGKI